MNTEPLASPRVLPQSPQPFSVITEHWQDKLQIPSSADGGGDNGQDNGLCSFGEVYEEHMYQLIHKHLELDTHDRFAYVGASKGTFVLLHSHIKIQYLHIFNYIEFKQIRKSCESLVSN